MAYTAIANVAINYRDYANNWIKAYEQGTTTPKPMALKSNGTIQVAKLEINVDGFLVSAGGALVVPFINGTYDLWMFPTEAEADANDTSQALRIADGSQGDDVALVDESVSLTDGQTTVIFDVVNANTATFYITGLSVDRGKLQVVTDYNIISSTEIELTSSFPEDSILVAVGSQTGAFGNEIADVIENKTLLDGQTEVVFVDVITSTARFYITGLNVDRGKLQVGTDYLIINETTIKLTSSFPFGSILAAIGFKDISGGTVVSAVQVSYDNSDSVLDDANVKAALDNVGNRQIDSTVELIASSVIFPAGQVISSLGYIDKGDGGGQWMLNGVIGQTASQSPAQLGAALLNDSNGNQWEMLLTNDVEFDTFAELELSNSGNVSQTLICRERANAKYIIQPSTYLLQSGDATLVSGLIAMLQVEGEANVRWFGAKGDNTADDTQAFKDTLARTYFIYIPAGIYLISDELLIRGQNNNEFEYFGVRGFGKNSAIIRQLDNDKDCFVVEKSALNDVAGKWMKGFITGLSIIYGGAVKANVSVGIKLTSCFDSQFTYLNMEGCTSFIESHGNGQLMFSKIRFKNGQRPIAEGPKNLFLLTNNADIYRSTGVYISDCEHFGAPIAENIFSLQAVDGLYVSNCHFNTALYKVNINMDNVDKRDVVKQVFFSNVYFDGNTDGQGTPILDTVVIQASGSANAVVDGLYFSNVFAREGRSFLVFNQSNVAGLEFVRDIVITGCTLRGYYERFIYLAMGDGRELDVISNIKIDSNIFEDAPLATPTTNLNAVNLSGTNISFTGNTVKGLWEDGAASPVVISNDAERCIVSGNVFDTLRSRTGGNKNVVISGGAVDTLNINSVPAE